MSDNWSRDINRMHGKYGHTGAARKMDSKMRNKLLKFRIDFLEEELTELKSAAKQKDGEEIVDALIDLVVVAIGTLDIFEVDANRAWNEVLNRNMQKESGVNKSRPNPLGLPDLFKPDGWEAPSHNGNHGLFSEL